MDELGGEHVAARESIDHVGDPDRRVAPVVVGEEPDVGCFVLVVEFFVDAGAELLDQFDRVEAREDHAEHRGERLGVVHVGCDGVGDAGVLDLHGDIAAVEGAGLVDLANRCGRDRLCVDVFEQFVQRLPETGFDFAQREIAGHRWGVAAEPRQRFTHRLGHALVEVARHLAELHHPALHVPEGVDDVLGLAAFELCLHPAPALVVGEPLTRLGPGAVRRPAGSEAGHDGAASASSGRGDRRIIERRRGAAPAHGGDRREQTAHDQDSEKCARRAPHVRPRWMTRVRRRRWLRRSGPPAMQRALRPDRDRPNPAP